MNNRVKLLVLTGSLGDGHQQAAQAIREAARHYRSDVDVEVVDYLEWTHPYLHTVGKYCYIQWVKSMPSVYGFFYSKTRGETPWSHWFKKMRAFSTGRMLELLDAVQPTAVVSTFPGAAAAMSYLKACGLTKVTTMTVLTDYTDHSYWVHPYTDRYLVGAEQVKQQLIRHRVPADRIVVTGIPIRLSFTQTYDRQALRSKYGLDPAMPTVLVMGGGYGLIGRQMLSVLQTAAFSAPVQFILVCGRNEKLRQKLEEELGRTKTPHRIVVTGYVDHVHELMALSDMIVTKPGGLTVSEALALELPMMLYKPIPGQEQDNAAYLVGLGAAMEARDTDELKRRLQMLVHNESVLMKLKRNTRAVGTKEGAYRTLAAILDMAEAPHAAGSSGVPYLEEASG